MREEAFLCSFVQGHVAQVVKNLGSEITIKGRDGSEPIPVRLEMC